MDAIQLIRHKFGPVPEGFLLEVIEVGPHFLAGPVYIITLTGFYNGQQYSAGDVLIKKNFSYVTAIRDNLKFTHWQHMRALVWDNPAELATLLETWGRMPNHAYA